MRDDHQPDTRSAGHGTRRGGRPRADGRGTVLRRMGVDPADLMTDPADPEIKADAVRCRNFFSA